MRNNTTNFTEIEEPVTSRDFKNGHLIQDSQILISHVRLPGKIAFGDLRKVDRQNALCNLIIININAVQVEFVCLHVYLRTKYWDM